MAQWLPELGGLPSHYSRLHFAESHGTNTGELPEPNGPPKSGCVIEVKTEDRRL